jgi:hypothetical protein
LADLWNAFTCAFVLCGDIQGFGRFVCSDSFRGDLEGATLRLTQSDSVQLAVLD